MSITQPDPTVTLQPVPFDLYRDVHKGIRANLFAVVVTAGRVDPTDRPSRVELATQVRDLVEFLNFHAAHEDRELDPAIRSVLPDRAEEIAAEHAALDVDMARLVELATVVVDAPAGDARVAAHELYIELAAFTSRYLAHQDVEERIVGPALAAGFAVEELIEIHGRILAAISPAQMGWSLAKMVPEMNVEDRTEMFTGMRTNAPPEAFEAMLGLAADVLPASDFDALAGRLARIPAGLPS